MSSLSVARIVRLSLGSERIGLFLMAAMLVAMYFINSHATTAKGTPALSQADIETLWLNGAAKLSARRYHGEKPPYWSRNECVVSASLVVRRDNTASRNLCITEGELFSIGEAVDGEKERFISFRGDKKYYYLANLNYEAADLRLVGGTNRVFIARDNPGRKPLQILYMFDSFQRALIFDSVSKSYKMNETYPPTTLPGIGLDSVNGWGVSKNGRYLAYGTAEGMQEAAYTAVASEGVLLDIQKAVWRRFGYVNVPSPDRSQAFAVSNDGAVVAGASLWQIDIIPVNEACLVAHLYDEDVRHLYPGCKRRRERIGYPHDGNRSYGLSIGDDNMSIRFMYGWPETEPGNAYPYELRLPDPSGLSKKLKYLALGDSYSSGEGDVYAGDSRHYILDTGVRGGCHLSSRSYPFILQLYWNIENGLARSVACSGAEAMSDYAGNSARYLGQGGRLVRLSARQREKAAANALSTFIPGTVPQLEFVKKYRPAVLTLTGGGNDVGFAEVLRYCAAPAWEGLFVDDTCRYAKEKKAYAELVNSIRSQYGTVRRLVHKIQVTSPLTKIYIIGYPQFIAQPMITCSFNAAALNGSERQMIREMVTEMNNVLWRAAEDSGATFIDIENSLDGGQLCQGGKYITGLHDLGLEKIRKDDLQEVFHPNAKGHLLMAKAIYQQIPDVYADAKGHSRNALHGSEYEAAQVSRRINMTKDRATSGGALPVRIGSHTFQPGSKVTITAHSRPTELGSFAVNNDGGLSIDIMLPSSVRPGRHVLVVEGTSFSGEPITLYQFVTVESGRPNDKDGDGIPDSEDPCQFIDEWYNEETGVNICAARAVMSDAKIDNEEGVSDAVSLAPTGVSSRGVFVLGLSFVVGGSIMLYRRRVYERTEKS